MSTALLSQGCGLWVLDDTLSPIVVRQILQTTGVQGLGGTRGVIDITNLDSTFKEKLPALQDPGSISFDIIYNPQDLGHQLLESMSSIGSVKVVKQFYLGLSDQASGNPPPTFTGTLAAPPYVLKQPKVTTNFARTGFVFSAFVKQWAREAPVDGIVKVKAGLEVTGAIVTGVAGAVWS